MARRKQGTGTVVELPNGKFRGVFEAGYTPAGNRRRLSVTANTRRGAERLLQARIKEHAASGTQNVNAGNMNVKRWLETWLKDREATVRPKTYAAEAGPLNLHVIPAIGQVKLRGLTVDHIRQVRAAMESAGCSVTTIRYTQRIFQQALRDAVAEGKTVPDAVLTAKRPPAASSTREAIPLEDAIKMIKIASRNEGTQDGSRWAAALLQGMRQGECLGLRWDAVSFEDHTITIDRQLQEFRYADRARDMFNIPAGLDAERLEGRFFLTPPKTAKGRRIIPMVGPMEMMLRDWRDRAPANVHGLVWPSPITLGPENKASDLRGWKDLQAAAGVSKEDGGHFVLHEARNTTATLLLAAHVDPFIITQILGHTSIVTSQGYMRVSQDQERSALERVANMLEMGAAK